MYINEKHVICMYIYICYIYIYIYIHLVQDLLVNFEGTYVNTIGSADFSLRPIIPNNPLAFSNITFYGQYIPWNVGRGTCVSLDLQYIYIHTHTYAYIMVYIILLVYNSIYIQTNKTKKTLSLSLHRHLQEFSQRLNASHRPNAHIYI